MHKPTNGRRKIALVGMGLAACSLVFVTCYIFLCSEQPLPVMPISSRIEEDNKQENLVVGSPVRIVIPKINVDAVLEYVGLTSEGEMDEPTEANNAAWLNRHPLPGEAGTSVIAGHFGFKDNKPAVFDNLHKLSKGDKVYVKDSKGATVAFVVQELRNYTPEQDATEVFSSNDGKSHLNLITCKGTWNKSLQSYNTRLVVFANRTTLEAIQ